jgi:O-antigen ligase
MLLISLCVNSNHKALLKTVCNIGATASFFLSSLAYFVHLPETDTRRFFARLAIIAFLSAVISIVLFNIGYAPSVYDGTRLSFIGRAGNPILGALIYGIAGLGALHMAQTSSRTTSRVLYLAISAFLGVAISLTGSRMAIIDYFGCVILGAIAYSKSIVAAFKVLASTVVIIVITCAIAGVHKAEGFVQSLIMRGDNFRFELWKQTLGLIKERPLLGHGFQTRLTAPLGAPEAYNPHNLYLATAFYVGIPAAMWFLFIVTLCLRASANALLGKNALSQFAAIVFIFGCFSGLTDHAQLVKTPSPLWIILWMPIAFSISRQMARTGDKDSVLDRYP